MSTLEKLKDWLSLGSKQTTITVPDEYVATVKDALDNRQTSQKVTDIANLIASQDPLVWADVRAVVEFYWGGELDPEDYSFVGGKESLKWWEEQLMQMESEALEDVPSSGFKVLRDQKGNPRWFGWVSNCWKDRENEIITSAAHEEFIKWLDENPEEAPELWSWHTRGTSRENRADWWDFSNGFLIMSGPLTEDEAKSYEKLGDRELGMSHGFFVLKQSGPLILKYRTFEVSDLERKHAANPYTAIEIIGEKMFNPTKRNYLIDLFGEDTVTQLESETTDLEKALDEAGITRKELDEKYLEYLEEEAQSKAQENVDEQVDELLEQIKTALNVEQLREVLQSFGEELEGLKGIKSEVETLSEEVKALKETEDQRISSLFSPREPMDWSQSVTKSDDNVVEEDDLDDDVKEDVQKGKEEFNWLKGMSVDKI